MYKRSLIWLRRDLRVQDSRAWSEAEKLSGECAVVFVFDSEILRYLEPNDRRLSFILDSLEYVRAELKRKKSDLIVLYGDPTQEIPKLVRALGCDALFYNRDYEPYAKRRDAVVEETLRAAGVASLGLKDHVIFEADELKTGAGTAFKVFTPYAKAWRKTFTPLLIREAKVSLEKLIPASTLGPQSLSLKRAGFSYVETVKGGSKIAEKLLETFLESVRTYHTSRNFPATGGTSRLSIHLRFGTISTREVLRAVSRRKDTGADTWFKEIIWREFYQMILSANPRLPDHTFNPKYDHLEWPGSRAHFKVWVEGKTGYPLVDAAMRHFRKTGWMHNRLRMVVASFLTKDLLCNYRWGEKYFADYLLDFELASNNGGWQWAASVGCDAQPYFRIFNPVLQSERFDAEAKFIKQELPELAKLPARYAHAPWLAPEKILAANGFKLGKDYPSPIVDHAKQKPKAIALFRNA